MNVLVRGIDELDRRDSSNGQRRIEELLRKILVEVATLKTTVNNHIEQDRESFDIVGKSIITLREDMTKRLNAQDEDRGKLAKDVKTMTP